MRLLAFDAALRNSGWCLYENAVVAVGLIKTKPKQVESESLAIIHRAVADLVEAHQPELIVMEDQYLRFNVKTLKQLSAVRGAIQAVAGLYGLPCLMLEATKVKKAVSGMGHATKEQIMESIRNTAPPEIIDFITSLPKQDDVSDAIAIALTAAHKEDSVHE